MSVTTRRKPGSNPQLVTNSLKKLKAFELRYQGKPFSYISSAIKVNASTIGTYFSREWKTDYEKYAEEQNQLVIKWSHQTLRRSLEPAVNSLVSLLDSKDERIKLRASIELLDRCLPADPELGLRDPVEALLEEYRLMRDGEIIIDDEDYESGS